MGSQSSKATINSLNERITEIATSSVANCQTSTAQSQSQDMVISGIFSWGSTATATQNTEIRSSCLNDDQLIQNLQNQVIDTIGSATSADGIAVLPAFGNTTAEQIVNLNNTVRTSLSKTNISNNYNSLMQEQKQTLKNASLFQFGTSLVAKQGAEVFAEAVLKSLVDSQVMSTVQSHLEIQTKATSNNPLDIIGRAFSSVFGGLATVLGSTAGTIMFTVFALIVGIVSIVVLFNKSGSTKGLTDDVGMALKARAGVVGKPPAKTPPTTPALPPKQEEPPRVEPPRVELPKVEKIEEPLPPTQPAPPLDIPPSPPVPPSLETIKKMYDQLPALPTPPPQAKAV